MVINVCNYLCLRVMDSLSGEATLGTVFVKNDQGHCLASLLSAI